MFALGVSVLNGAAMAAAIGVVLVIDRIAHTAARAAQPDRAAGRGGPRPALRRQQTARRQARLLASLGAAGAAATGTDRDRRDGADARARGSGARPAAGFERRRQRSGQPDDAPGVRPPRKGLRSWLQRAPAGRRGAPQSHDTAAVTQLTHALTATRGVASVAAPRPNATGTAAAIVAYPTTSPQSAQTSSLVTRLRDSVIPPSRADHGRTRVRRRRDGGAGRLLTCPREQAAAVHRGRRSRSRRYCCCSSSARW